MTIDWQRLLCRLRDFFGLEKAAVLREARAADVSRIKHFLEEWSRNNKDEAENMSIRPIEDYIASVEHEHYFILEVNCEIAAVAGVFHPESGDHAFELGGLVVPKEYRGGVQLLMLPLGMAAALLEDGAADMFSLVRYSNKASKRNMETAGFKLWESEAPLEPDVCRSCKFAAKLDPGQVCCRDVYYLPRSALCDHMRRLVESPPVISLPRRQGDPLLVKVRVRPLTDRRHNHALRQWIGRHCAGGEICSPT